jgi:hypothetical protein
MPSCELISTVGSAEAVFLAELRTYAKRTKQLSMSPKSGVPSERIQHICQNERLQRTKPI